ncbi:MAG: HAMP domain-containing histidine kinase [Actinomycetota bacterium]|nr:HAMP domain-containing histidine kinase [Actinomycetota bacterium]
MGPDRPGSWLARLRESTGTVRVRTTLGAVVVLGLSLIVASVALVVFIRHSLTEDVRVAARVRAAPIASDLARGMRPDAFTDTFGDDEFVQILDGNGRVIASSENIAGATPPPNLDQDGGSVQIDVAFDDDPFLAVADVSADGRTVIVGRSLDNVVESSSALVGILLIGVPLLVLFTGAVAWRLVGKALSPVEAIRSQVETISMKDLHRRVPASDTADEVGRLAATMNQMLGRLEQGRARQRRFVSDASHELRSPVASIRQHAEVAIAHPNSTSTRDLADVVLVENSRLQSLVEDLLLLTRMDEHDSDDGQGPVDLDDIVFAHMERIRAGNGRSLDTSGLSAGRVLGDHRKLDRMVANLVDNAVRHSEKAIAVSLAEEGQEVILRVDDDGPGVPPEDRSRIFERFVRLEEARDRDSGGAGLGLAIVAEVARSHGGLASVAHSPLGGSRFEVRLPRATSS